MQRRSVDPECIRAYLEDPLNTVGNVKARTGNETLQAFGRLQRAAKEISLPVYAVHGTGMNRRPPYRIRLHTQAAGHSPSTAPLAACVDAFLLGLYLASQSERTAAS